MNIGFFTDAYTPLMDGVVRSVQLYKKALERKGHNVFVFAPAEIKSDSFAKTNYVDHERNVFRFKAMNSVLVPNYPIAIPISFKATRKISKLKLDIVHCHSPVTLGMLGDIVAMLENIPHLFTYHTFYSEYARYYQPVEKLKKISSKVVQKFEVFYCNRANCVIAPSEKLKRILRDYGVESNIVVLPTGIDLEEFKNRENQLNDFREKYKIDKDKKILLYVGRVVTEKNLEFLIKVISWIIKQRKDVVLAIIGDGKNRKNLERMVAKLNLDDFVLFTGFLPRDETLDAFFASDIFVFSSKTDTQGLVLYEAALAGKPIVMIKDEGLGDIVIDGFNGFTTKEDVSAFSKKVLLLLKNSYLYDKMAENSEKNVQKYSIDNQAEKLLKLYQEVIREHKSSSWRIKFWTELNKEVKVPKWVSVNIKLDKFKKLFKFNNH